MSYFKLTKKTKFPELAKHLRSDYKQSFLHDMTQNQKRKFRELKAKGYSSRKAMNILFKVPKEFR